MLWGAVTRRSRVQLMHVLLQLVQLLCRGSHQPLSLQVQLQHLRLYAHKHHVMEQVCATA